MKTGACRFGNRCSRDHPRLASSRTLLLRGMYSHFSIGQQQRDDYDADAHLETEERDLQQDFEDFYWDVLPELRSVGRVVQFKVCRNHEPHLRGNVYVQYTSEEEATRALMMLNGRWYAGRQVTCEFTPVDRWKSAICGLFFRNACPKGKNCNFLHVFRNPTDEFRDADHDHVPQWWSDTSRRSHHHSQRSQESRQSPGRRRSPGIRQSRTSTSPHRSSHRHSRSPPSSRRSHHRRETSPHSRSRRSSSAELSSHSKSRQRHKDKKHKSKKLSKKRKRRSRSRTVSRSPERENGTEDNVLTQ